MKELTSINLKKILKDSFEDQAGLINSAFQEQTDHFDKRFDKIEDRLQLVETKLDRALYTEVVHLEARIKRLEQKVGVK